VRWAPEDLYSEAEVDLEYRPNVSLVVACHNEAMVADSLVRGLKALHYPRSRLEIILVNDGSTDGTGELLESLTAGDRHLQVLHRPAGSHGGKPGALKAAAEIARGPCRQAPPVQRSIPKASPDHGPVPYSSRLNIRRQARRGRGGGARPLKRGGRYDPS